jgi:hypothetical protein
MHDEEDAMLLLPSYHQTSRMLLLMGEMEDVRR